MSKDSKVFDSPSLPKLFYNKSLGNNYEAKPQPKPVRAPSSSVVPEGCFAKKVEE